MGRESTITADQVNAIADTIKAEGGKPTSRAIRERLGNTGSMGTINKLLQRWKSGQTRQAPSAIALPPALQTAILDFMDHELATARATLETELAEQQQEAADLASENERQMETIGALTDELAVVAGEKASAEGKAQQLATDLDAAQVEVANERQAAEHARTELAKAQLRLEAMPRLEFDLDAVRVELQRERAARTDAERAAAVLQAQKDDLQVRVDAGDAEIVRMRDVLASKDQEHKQGTQTQTASAASELARARSDGAAAVQAQKAEMMDRLADARAEATAALQAVKTEMSERLAESRAETARLLDQMAQMQARFDTVSTELGKAHAEAKRAAEEAAELRGKLSAPGDKPAGKKGETKQ